MKIHRLRYACRMVRLAMLMVGLLPAVSRASGLATNSLQVAPLNDQVIITNEPEADCWSFAISAYAYFVPNDRDYIQPTLAADHDRLHLEARYNYEDLDTGSGWVGCNFSGGETVSWEITPMIGGVVGDTTGVAPGYKGMVLWRQIGLYGEGEYVFDTEESSDSYFYNWSELTLSPADWFRTGLVVQRTRIDGSGDEVQPGVLVGFTYKRVDVSAYLFDSDADNPTFVMAVALTR